MSALEQASFLAVAIISVFFSPLFGMIVSNFNFFLFTAAPVAYGGSQARSRI